MGRRGPRPKPPEEQYSQQVVIHVTPGLRRRLQVLADSEGLSLNRFCRDTLLLEADRMDGGRDHE
jgi:predicted HicB family RNase H-like nuclease